MHIAAGAQKAWKRQYGQLGKENKLSLEDVQYLTSLLRGDFDKAVSLRVQFQYAEEKLISLTREQYKCVDQLEDNPRCLIKGSAGTGRTLLAIEETKKAVANNERVALFCYNSMLGNWLEDYFENMVIILTDVESFHDVKLMYVGLSRARSGLYIFETETANKEYGELIRRRYFNG